MNQRGQSLIEVVVALSMAAIIITALLVVVINSLKNAKLAQLQSKATKYAQDGLERVREIRDRNQDGDVGFTNWTGGTSRAESVSGNASSCASGSVTRFSDLYCNQLIPANCLNGLCYFKLQNNSPHLTYETLSANYTEDLGDSGLTRQITITDGQTNEKIINVVVLWSDSTGKHQSNLQSILRHL